MAQEQTATTAAAFAAGLFPEGTRFAAEAAIEDVFVPQRGVEENWIRFRRQFMAAGWVGFSDIVFTPDQTDALMYWADERLATGEVERIEAVEAYH